MSIRRTLITVAIATGLAGTILPALAENPGGTHDAPGEGMGVDPAHHGAMSGSMMSSSMMSGGMNGGGCDGMMQSMNGGDGRPNSQWQSGRRPADRPSLN